MSDSTSTAGLVDITTIAVEKSLPEDERLKDYVRQIGDPYNFTCGPYNITAIYPANGKSMADCLRGAVR